jgi:DNA-binding response OmpR family regulator
MILQGGKAAVTRPTVLVVEDEFIVAFDLAETVRDEGYMLAGPYAHGEEALEMLDRDHPDAAILDVQLADGEVYSLADRLTERGIPIVFHSGHETPRALLARYPNARACTKPCPPCELLTNLRDAVHRAAA